MSHRLLLPALALLAVAACAPAGHGQFVEPPLTALHFPAPEFPRPGLEVSGTTWLNSPPLTMAQLRGKVVMIDFWEYTCINCVRTFAQIKKWYERYHGSGFEIIGVHAPEFDIAYAVDNVAAAVKRFGLAYPVVVDNWYEIWKSYRNNAWPSRFLIDAQGFVRFHRDGEGADDEFERAIRRLLQEVHPALKFPGSEPIPPEENAAAPGCGVPTPEMYVGRWYGRGILVNKEGYHPGETVRYNLPSSLGDGRAAVSGPWETDQNGMIYRGKSQKLASQADRLEMRYHARELYAVMSVAHGKPSRLYILQDGKDLTAASRGVDVQFDSEGHSYIEVRDARMYYLVQNPAFGSHTVALIPTAPGLAINSFTFGNNCQTQFPHL